jgi:hypothetical protein
MKKITLSLVTAVLAAGVCSAQTSGNMQAGGSASQDTSVSADKSGARANTTTSAAASQQAAASSKSDQMQAASQLQASSTVQAELTRPVDARKNKVGDEVVAKTTQDVKSDGKIVLRKGSKIMSKVTQAQARAKGQEESQLSIAFDHAILKDGTRMPVAFTIQAISASPAAAATSAAMEDDSMSGSAGGMAPVSGPAPAGGLVSGVGSTAGNVVNTAGSAAGATLHSATATGVGVGGSLTAQSQGVVGLRGLTLSSAASSSTSTGSTISSKSTNVHLDSGTRMVLRVNGQ